MQMDTWFIGQTLGNNPLYKMSKNISNKVVELCLIGKREAIPLDG